MLNSILIGMMLAMVTIAIHAIGTTTWIWRLQIIAVKNEQTNTPPFVRHLKVLCSTAMVLLSLHLVEAIVWGMAYLLLIGNGAPASCEEAIYFSTVTFASLGYGDVVIEGPWRMLSAIQSMTGLLAFGWSSALLFVIVQHIIEVGGNSNRIITGREES